MSGSGFRASIPNSVRRTIQNIKEITGNHSEEDIYAMLKECSMDPNETTQKLLLQDTFHEVKRKRDRRKENLNNRESVEPRWRPGTQGRGARGGRGNFHLIMYHMMLLVARILVQEKIMELIKPQRNLCYLCQLLKRQYLKKKVLEQALYPLKPMVQQV
ncbi:hypothetical protein E2542_SST20869 [Spatholobus suberectus]|nr:hypothetical protein E2542_SST20869 [Spatholobus suberectus]